MSIKVLDCTLRDGGYCNEWRFGLRNIINIVNALATAGIDVIECGFLTNKINHQSDITRFNSVRELKGIIPTHRSDNMYVLMINYGEYTLDELIPYEKGVPDGIRVAFHKKDMRPALEFCRGVKDKGYKLFIQAMVSLSYSDEEFLELIRQVNALEPYAFYIVDSFGVMKRKDLLRLFYVVEHNLKSGIAVGFHAHNNMQLAYSNAQMLVDLHTKKNIIIDSTVFGMGRGAGNLNTELFVEYLNDNADTNYQLRPLLNIIDEVLNNFYKHNQWGYSLPNYLSAHNNAHPNYAKYLFDRQTLTFEDMNEILRSMDDRMKFTFDKNYAEALYVQYMSRGQVQLEHEAALKHYLSGKTVLLIAPGQSALDEKQKIIEFSKLQDVCVISINHEYPFVDANFIFLSNLRRYRNLEEKSVGKCIVTSNIFSDKAYLRTSYSNLIDEEEYVSDNAGMMAIRFMILCGVKDVFLAGFDGYSHDIEENYIDGNMMISFSGSMADARNRGMQNVLSRLSNSINLKFLTTPRYLKPDLNAVGANEAPETTRSQNGGGGRLSQMK